MAPPGEGIEAASISACVINFNGEKYLRDCLQSLRDLEQPIGEVLLVDNGSEDQSLLVVREEFPEVRIIELGQNHGPCVARNVALTEAQHRWVFAIDNDVIVEPSCLTRLLEARERWGRPAVLQPRSIVDDERHDTVHYDGASVHYVGLMSLRHFYHPVESCTREDQAIDCAISLALLLDRERLQAVGMYDANYFILFEDFDLSIRLRLMGERLVSVPGAIVYHREGTKGVSFRGETSYPDRRAFYHSRNRWILILKHYRVRSLLLCLPGIWIYEMAWIVFCAAQGTVGAYLKGKISLARILPAVLFQRAKIQRSRVLEDRDLLRCDPLTFWPSLLATRRRRLEKRVLDGLLGAWFRLIRRLL